MSERLVKITGFVKQKLVVIKALAKTALRAARAHLRLLALVLTALVILASIVWVRPFVVRVISDYREKRARLPYQYIEYATNVLIEAQRYDEAFTYLQTAIDKMTLPEDRAAAGLVMAEFLLRRAESEPEPYAQMARGYLVASLNIEQQLARKLKMYKALVEAAEIMRDWDMVLNVCVQAKGIAEADADRAWFILKQLDVLLKTGSWDEFDKVWAGSGDLKEQSEWRLPFELRLARMYERVMTDDEWYQAWLSAQTVADPAAVRSSLLNKSLALCDAIAKQSPDFAAETLFMAIKLCVSENRFADARDRIRDYFEKNYKTHQEEILLILIRMARLEGKQQQSEELITQFLRRYQWFSRASDELLAVITQAESVGHYQEALDILEEYLKLPAAQDNAAALYFKAGELAQRLQLYDRALAHYNKVIAANPDESLLVATLMAKSEIFLALGDYAVAQDLIVRALTGFPFDPRRGGALYRLVDVFRNSEVPVADRLLVTSLAVDVMKNDPRVVDLLMELARSYEELGLYADAHENYAKVALLRTVDSLGREQSPDSQRLMEALLGSARCLTETGDYVRADQLLRELAQSAEAGEIFSHAAYLWASIAFKEKQYQESDRRLSLIDTSKCSPELKIRVDLDRLLLDVAADRITPQQAVESLEGYSSLSDIEKLAFADRAYRICFERMLQERNTVGMQEFIDALADDSKGLPIDKWVMELASVVMADQGTGEFVRCLKRNAVYMQEGSEALFDINALAEIAGAVDGITGKVNQYTR